MTTIQEKGEYYQGDTNIFYSIFNLSNAAIGMGMFSFAFAYLNTGLLSGIITTLLLVLIAGLTLIILIYYSDDCSSYQELILKRLGSSFSFICEIILIFYLAGGCIGFLNIIGDIYSPVVSYWIQYFKLSRSYYFLSDRRFIIFLVTIFIILPITFFKNMKWLGLASFIAIFSAAYTVCYITVMGSISLSQKGIANGTIILFHPSFEFFTSIPLICLSFQCHIHVVPIYHELRQRSIKKMIFIIIISLFICLLFYTFVGFFGYTMFGSNTKGNVIINFNNDIPTGIARINIGILVALSYPLRYFATRKVIESLFYKNGMSKEIDYIITILFVIFTILLSIFIPDIVDIFGIIGSIGAMSLMFIFPSLILYFHSQKIYMKIFSIILILFGVILGIFGTVMTCINMRNKYIKN